MSMALSGVIDIRINATLENLVVIFWISRTLPRGFGEMDISEGWYVAQIEDEVISQVDGLIQKFVTGYHGSGGSVPCSPHLLPIFNGRDFGPCVFSRIGTEVDCGWLQHV